jgi:hypothetical protein
MLELLARVEVVLRHNGRKFDLDIEPIVCPQGFAALLAPVLSDEMEAMKRAGTGQHGPPH